jgi:hypothetical protein
MVEERSYVRWPVRFRTRARPLGPLLRAWLAVVDSRPSRALTRAVLRRPPNSLIRRLWIRPAVRLALITTLAGDRKRIGIFFEPDAEIVVPQWPGLAERYEGGEGFLDFFDAWLEIWGELELEQVEAIDLGSRLVLFGRMHTIGGTSGVSTTQPYASLQEYGRERVERGEWFMTWEEGMAAVGLEGEPPPG